MSCLLVYYSTNERDLTIHEQAVWMLLSRVELSSPNDSLLSNSMVDSFVSDSMSLPDSHHTPVSLTTSSY